MAASTLRRLVTAVLLAAGLLLTHPSAAGGWVWDTAVAAGYLSIIAAILLYLYPLRGEGLARERLLSISQHRLLGWIALVAAALHVTLLLCSQPLVGRYLLPSAPFFMWCGVAALILTAVLIRKAGRWHTVIAAVMVLTVWGHLVGSGQAVRGVNKLVVVGLLLGLPVAWFAFRARAARRSPPIRIAAIASACLIALVPKPTGTLLLQPLSRPGSIAIVFPHESHTSVNCIVCHHNYVDGTGIVACIECHRSGRRDLLQASEATFHTFCRDCHTELANEGVKHGPTRDCIACHIPRSPVDRTAGTRSISLRASAISAAW